MVKDVLVSSKKGEFMSVILVGSEFLVYMFYLGVRYSALFPHSL